MTDMQRFEASFPELFWHIAKGRLSVDEPIYGATINTVGGMEIGAGESDVSVEDAFEIAFRNSGLEWPVGVTSSPAYDAVPDLIGALKALLKKHEPHHNSIEHSAARAVIAKATP